MTRFGADWAKCVLIVMLILAGAAQRAAADCEGDWFDRAIAANSEGRFEDLAAIATEIIEAGSPSCDHYAAFSFRGRARLNLGEDRQAAVDFERATSIDPDKCYAHLLLHVARYSLRERPLPTDGLTRCLSNDPFNRDAMQFLGGAHYANGDYSEAARVYQSLYLLTGSRNDRLTLIAATRKAGMLERAETLIRDAVAEMPDHWGGYEELANLLRSQGKFEEADRALQVAMDKLPEGEPHAEAFLADMFSTRARLYLAMEQPDKARAAAERALTVSEIAAPYLVLAEMAFADGATSRACKYVSSAAALDLGYAVLDDYEALAAKCVDN